MRRAELDDLLGALLDAYPHASDLNLSVDRPPQVAVDGELRAVAVTPPIDRLTPFQTEVLALNLIGGAPRLCEQLLAEGACDCSYALPGRARFRVNVFSQRGRLSLVLRQLAATVPTIDALGLPPAFRAIAGERDGLVLVVGATGSGKTTSLAAVLDAINASRAVHVVTLEDPVEYLHASRRATFNQRELGLDFSSFASGLRAALRQAPQVILVGEIRDRETAELALRASETGHLVLATLHAMTAGQAIGRFVGLFDPGEDGQIRQRLADTLRWVVGQRLPPRVGGGRLAIHDVLANTLRAQELVLHGEAEGKTFYEIQEVGGPAGMMTFDQALVAAYAAGALAEATAPGWATRRAVVQRGIDRVKQERGEPTTDVTGLRLDVGYPRRIRTP